MQFCPIEEVVCRSTTIVFPLLLAVILCRRAYRFKYVFPSFGDPVM